MTSRPQEAKSGAAFLEVLTVLQQVHRSLYNAETVLELYESSPYLWVRVPPLRDARSLLREVSGWWPNKLASFLEEKPQKLCLVEGNRLRGLDKEDATSCAFVIFVQSTSESNWGKLPRQAGKHCGLLNIDFG